MEQPIQELRSAQFDINATGDKVSIPIAFPMKVLRVGLMIQSADAGGASISFDKRITAGSDTGRVNNGVASLVLPASNQQGKFLYKKLVDLTSVELACGDEIVVEVTAEGAAASSFAVAIVEYLRIQENPVNLSDAVASV